MPSKRISEFSVDNTLTGDERIIFSFEGDTYGVNLDQLADLYVTLAQLATEQAARIAGDDAAVQRANHTGTQLASTISDFTEATQDVIGAATLGGSGLTYTYSDPAGTLVLAVNVDATTIEVNSDTLRVVPNTFDSYGSAAAAAAASVPLTQKGAANGVAPLDGASKIPTTYLPALAITSTSVVGSQAAMLALSAEEGDVAIRTDFTPRRAFILDGNDPTILANWEALDPATTVTTVNGSSGDVTITPSGIAALAVANNLSDLNSASTARTNLGLGTSATNNKVAAGNAGVLDATDPTTTNSRTPTGTAAGGLTGTYPNPSVRRVLGPFSLAGAQTVAPGVLRLPVTLASTLVSVRATLNTAPTGASFIIDVNKNGTTIFTNQSNRPTIAISTNDSGAGNAPDVTALAVGDYITIDVDQIGSTVAGSDLCLVIEVTTP